MVTSKGFISIVPIFAIIFFAVFLVGVGIIVIKSGQHLPLVNNSQNTQQTPLVNNLYENSCYLKGYNGEDIGSISGNLCRVAIPISKTESYVLLYPRDWTSKLVGAGGVNLFFNENTGNDILVVITTSDLPLEQSDRATVSFEMAVDPIVNRDEKLTFRIIQNIGKQTVLIVDTTKDDQTFRYYFVQKSGAKVKYLFAFRTSKNNSLSPDVFNSFVNSLNIVPGGFH